MAEEMKSVYRKSTYFQFNLLPGQSEVEIQTLEDRDDSSLYALVLIFSGVFIFFALSLLQLIFIDTRKEFINNQIEQVESQIANYNDVKAINGEVFQKSSLLSEPLEKDIKLSRLLEISSDIVQDQGTIVAYGKRANGDYSLTANVESVENALQILENSKQIAEIQNSYLTSVSRLGVFDTTLRITVTFDILRETEQI